MKKFNVLVVVILVILAATFISHEIKAASTAVGATPRQPHVAFPGETNFTNIGVVGSDKTGIPGYIVLYSMDVGNVVTPRYLWFDKSGNLRTASYITMITYASFPDVSSWDASVSTGDMGSKVGSQ